MSKRTLKAVVAAATVASLTVPSAQAAPVTATPVAAGSSSFVFGSSELFLPSLLRLLEMLFPWLDWGTSSNSDEKKPAEPTDPNAPDPATHIAGWTLKHRQVFDSASTQKAIEQAQWVVDPYGKDSKWNVDQFDDDGEYFTGLGGAKFKEALDSFNLMRKQVRLGEGGWLTAEYAARDYDKDKNPDNPPSIEVTNLGAKLNVPNDGALLLTSTDPLPSSYRVEYELKTLDFGGKRNGKWESDDGKKYNGYVMPDTDKGECKTNFPWQRAVINQDIDNITDPCGTHEEKGKQKANWGSVTNENGYYLLSIMDYAHPAPHNNIFIHSHRKVGMDIYSVNAGWAKGYGVCNPRTGEVMEYTDASANGVNAIFFDGKNFRDKRFAYNQFIMDTPCGLKYGDTKGGKSIVSAVELQPEFMPGETYKFAIERVEAKDGKPGKYVQEMSGNFKYVGQQTYRFERPFVGTDGRPIWHYNQTPDEYNGTFNQKMTFNSQKDAPGAYEEFTKDMWPSGSAYPDNFVIGIPHINYYEGSATVNDIRLYVPEESK